MSFEFNLIFVLTAAIGILTPRRAEESTGEPGWAHLPNKPNSLPWQGWTYQTCAQHILKYRILHNPRLSMPKKAKQVGNAFWAVPTAGPYNRFCHMKWVKFCTVVLYRNGAARPVDQTLILVDCQTHLAKPAESFRQLLVWKWSNILSALCPTFVLPRSNICSAEVQHLADWLNITLGCGSNWYVES